jgi:prolyl-tRNA editing enzyme YbaK/EbsC (Cys-tRNA(Pro) deacylase)
MSQDSRAAALRARQEVLLARLLRLEAVRLIGSDAASLSWGAEQEELCPMHARLRVALEVLNVRLFRFHKVPADYYETTLDARRVVLGALDCSQLCKTIAICNTAAPLEALDVDAETPLASRYLLVVVAYDSKFSVEKLRSFVHSSLASCGQPVAKKRLNFRLAEDIESLTGFSHGGVTPVGCRTRLPVVLSHRVADLKLAGGLFYLGAGDKDLKLSLRVADFMKAYTPIVADVCDNQST